MNLSAIRVLRLTPFSVNLASTMEMLDLVNKPAKKLCARLSTSHSHHLCATLTEPSCEQFSIIHMKSGLCFVSCEPPDSLRLQPVPIILHLTPTIKQSCFVPLVQIQNHHRPIISLHCWCSAEEVKLKRK